MNKIGITIRKIRLIKGLTQKQVYTGIISRSFANRFESGSNDIQTEKFFQILNNLGISPNEFQYIHNNYQHPKVDQMLLKVSYLYETHSFSTLATWLKQHKNNHDAQVKIVAGYAEILMSTFNSTQFPVTKNVETLTYHLLNEKNWTLQELKIIGALIPIISTHKKFNITITEITKRVEQNYSHYLTTPGDPFHITQELINYYGIVLQNYLNNEKYSDAYNFKNKFNLDRDFLNWDVQISQQLWLAVWELYFADYDLGKQKIDMIINFKSTFKTSFALNIDAIAAVRLKDAKQYRQSKAKEQKTF